MEEIIFQPVGIIHTPYREKAGVPIQGVFDTETKAEVEVFPQFAEGLDSLDGFTHIFLIYHFNQSSGYDLITKPFLENRSRGVFSIRAPRRPNPIGLSIVRLEKVKGNILEISEVDILDGTPLLDIKPYIPQFDNRVDASSGWAEKPMQSSNPKLIADRRFYDSKDHPETE